MMNTTRKNHLNIDEIPFCHVQIGKKSNNNSKY